MLRISTCDERFCPGCRGSGVTGRRDVAQRLLSTRLVPVPQRGIELSPADRAVASRLARTSRPINDLTDGITASEQLLGLRKSVTPVAP
jgi:hypothetical protein